MVCCSADEAQSNRDVPLPVSDAESDAEEGPHAALEARLGATDDAAADNSASGGYRALGPDTCCL